MKTNAVICGALWSLALATGALAQSAPVSPTPAGGRVIFVCEHGSVKSLIAASYFNRRAQERNLQVRAVARGATPDRNVPKTVKDGLHADGFDVSRFRPQAFTGADVRGAKLVVSFDQNVSKVVAGQVRYIQWDDLPGVLADYARGRDAIVEHVDSLLEMLAQHASP